MMKKHKYPRSFIEQFKQDFFHYKNIFNKISIRAKTLKEGRVLKKAGKDHLTLCVFHSEKTPSLRIHKRGDIWYFKCLGCGKSGDIFSLFQHVYTISFFEAVEMLVQGKSYVGNPPHKMRFPEYSKPSSKIEPLVQGGTTDLPF